MPFFGRVSWLVYEEDDFFYYLKVAQNLVHGHGSTFNGIVSTNGYHPLWLAIIALGCGISQSSEFLAMYLFTLIFAATIATYFFAERILRRHSADRLVTASFAAYIAVYSMHVFTTGMEVVVTIPAIFAAILLYQGPALWKPRFLPAFGFGMLLSAIFLSRLDTLLFIMLLMTFTVVHPALRSCISFPQVSGIVLGFLPAPFYLISNRIFFHTWLPVSGMAKQLKPNLLPTSAAWISLFHKSAQGLVNIYIIAAAIPILFLVFKRLTKSQQVIYPLLLFFPFFYLTILCCTSDWPLWDWYFYCLRIALCLGFAVFLAWRPTVRLLAHSGVAGAIGGAALALLALNHRPRLDSGLTYFYEEAVEVQEFAKTHPGVYAMGDRSGSVGYMLPHPLVQTEGLVMDPSFLKLIQQETPLLDALSRYHVRYYVATATAPFTGCFHAIEPAQAGPASPHMSAVLCQQPLASFQHGVWRTMIYEVDTPPHLFESPNQAADQAGSVRTSAF